MDAMNTLLLYHIVFLYSLSSSANVEQLSKRVSISFCSHMRPTVNMPGISFALHLIPC